MSSGYGCTRGLGGLGVSSRVVVGGTMSVGIEALVESLGQPAVGSLG